MGNTKQVPRVEKSMLQPKKKWKVKKNIHLDQYITFDAQGISVVGRNKRRFTKVRKNNSTN